MTPGCAAASWEDRWGIPAWEPQKMTICIAALCEAGRGLILACDRELGIEITSAEFDDGKFDSPFRNWFAGFSGNVSNATEILNTAARKDRAPPSLASYDVIAAIEKAYREVRLEKAEARFLANRGWTLKEFKAEGAQKMPPSAYATIDAQISMLNMDADLLVAGFGPDNEGSSIFTITNPGTHADHTQLGFWCIGSGATAAQMSLFERGYSFRFSAEKAAYYVWEAKRSTERATGVGRITDLYLQRPNQTAIPLQNDAQKLMDKIREELRPKEFESEHAKALSDLPEFTMFRQSASF